MNTENLKEIIIRQNQNFESEKNFITRDVFLKLKEFINIPHIVVISWLRRVGKSTLLKQIKTNYFKKLKNIYLNFEDEKLLWFEVSDFDKLLETYFWLNNNSKTYFFDEIQNIEKFELAIRRLYDEWYKFFITWSNANLLSQELWTRLTGRYIKVELYPFSFKEFLKFNNVVLQKDDLYFPEKRALIINYFDEYLHNWWLPEYLKYKNEEVIKQVYDDIIYKDILVRYNITDNKTFKELTKYLITNITKEFSYNKLKNILWFWSLNTVKSYINYLENSYLLFSIEKFDYSLKKQIINPKKIYVIDISFYNLIGFSFSQNNGQKLENLVFIELKRKSVEIFYHRNKKECDFLIKDRWNITLAIQVSRSLYEVDTKKREIDWLLEALNMYDLKEWMILTYDEEETLEKDGKTIKILPVWKWLIQNSL